MPSTDVPANQDLGGIGNAVKTDFSSEEMFSSPPQSKKARTGTVNLEVRTPGGRYAESKTLLYDKQRGQQV